MKKLLATSIAALLSLSVAGYAAAQQTENGQEQKPAHHQQKDAKQKPRSEHKKEGQNSEDKKGHKTEGKHEGKKSESKKDHKAGGKHEGKKASDKSGKGEEHGKNHAGVKHDKKAPEGHQANE